MYYLYNTKFIQFSKKQGGQRKRKEVEGKGREAMVLQLNKVKYFWWQEQGRKQFGVNKKNAITKYSIHVYMT